MGAGSLHIWLNCKTVTAVALLVCHSWFVIAGMIAYSNYVDGSFKDCPGMNHQRSMHAELFIQKHHNLSVVILRRQVLSVMLHQGHCESKECQYHDIWSLTFIGYQVLSVRFGISTKRF